MKDIDGDIGEITASSATSEDVDVDEDDNGVEAKDPAPMEETPLTMSVSSESKSNSIPNSSDDPSAVSATDKNQTSDPSSQASDATKSPAETEKEKAEAEAEAAKKLQQERRIEFNKCLSEGQRMLQKIQKLPDLKSKVANDYHEKAAACYTRAIELAGMLPMLKESEITTLYNNRAAMYEKAGKMTESLSDCAMVLTMKPGHVKARKRRARIYQAQDRPKEALVEYCAVLVADTLDVRQKLEPFKHNPQAYQTMQQQLMQSKMEEQQAVQAKLQELMGACGKKRADAVIAKRKGKPDGGMPKIPGSGIVSESSVLQLLLSYTEYLDLEEEAKNKDPLVLKAKVLEANSVELPDTSEGNDDSSKLEAGAAKAKIVAALRERAMHHMACRNYAEAADDFMAAYAVVKPKAEAQLKTYREFQEAKKALKDGEKVPELAGEDPTMAGLLRWVGLFHHVKYDLEGALEVYSQAEAFFPTNPHVLVMKSGVYVDKGELDDATKIIDAAAAMDPTSVDMHYHRCQLTQLAQMTTGGMAQSTHGKSAEDDIRSCLELRPGHVVALLRLAMMLVTQAQAAAEEARMNVAMLAQQGKSMGVEEQGELNEKLQNLLKEAEEKVAEADKIRPSMSEVYQVKASCYEAKGDFDSAMRAHEKSIALDPKNPTPYINKGMLLQQLQQMEMMQTGMPPADPKAMGMEVVAQFEKAIEVDPLCSQAHKMIAETKLSFATQFHETEAIVADLDCAIKNCRDPTELQELCTFASIASAQLEAAKDLGMSSFAELT